MAVVVIDGGALEEDVEDAAEIQAE